VYGPVESSYLLRETKINETCNSFIKRSYERLACQLTKILYRLYTIFLTELSVFETELLSKGLCFCFFPTKFHLNNIRAEFERVYFELKRFFVTRDLLVLKQKLMSLCGRYVSTCFHERFKVS